jgi:hypothetical protein
MRGHGRGQDADAADQAEGVGRPGDEVRRDGPANIPLIRSMAAAKLVMETSCPCGCQIAPPSMAGGLRLRNPIPKPYNSLPLNYTAFNSEVK